MALVGVVLRRRLRGKTDQFVEVNPTYYQNPVMFLPVTAPPEPFYDEIWTGKHSVSPERVYEVADTHPEALYDTAEPQDGGYRNPPPLYDLADAADAPDAPDAPDPPDEC